MTDPRSHDPGGRLDLRALDAGHDAARAEAIVRAAMSAVAASRPEDDLTRLVRFQRAWLVAAAVLAAIATAAVVAAPRRFDATSSTDVIASWSESSHVPTNGELLATYHGYRP